MRTKLKPYMVYSRNAGPEEGALLVFHFNARHARYMGWLEMPFGCDSYIDATARLIRDPEDVHPLTNVQLLEANLPHVIDSPEVCQACELWGLGVDANGRCNGCGEPVGDRLLEKLEQWKEHVNG